VQRRGELLRALGEDRLQVLARVLAAGEEQPDPAVATDPEEAGRKKN